MDDWHRYDVGASVMRAVAVLAVILAAAWVIWSVFVALGVFLVTVALALIVLPFFEVPEAEDNAFGDWPTIIDLDADNEP